MIELITAIRAKQVEQAKCLAELDLWSAVQAQGIAIGTVDKFGFKAGFYDYVKHRDGSVTRLQPILKAL